MNGRHAVELAADHIGEVGESILIVQSAILVVVGHRRGCWLPSM